MHRFSSLGKLMLRIQITLFAISIVIAGCRSATVPSPVLQPAVTASSDDMLDKPSGPWVLTPSRQPHTYHSISQTRVHELSNSTTHQDASELTTVFTISLDRSYLPFSISGHVDTVKFHTQDQPSPKNQELNLPLVFKGQLAPSGLTINVTNFQPITGTCNPFISLIIGDLHAATTTYPLQLAPDFTWTDSTSVTTCTPGGILTTRKTIQLFRTIGERAFNTTRVLLLQRLDSIYISGDGAQGNHQVHLEGVGTATANLYISPITTFTLGADLSEKLELTITNSGKTRRFIQEVTQRLEIRN